MGGLSAEFHLQHQQALQQQALQQQAAMMALDGPPKLAQLNHQRVTICSKDDSLRTVVERLAIPGMRRLIVVQPETRRVEGLVSLSDVAAYLFV